MKNNLRFQSLAHACDELLIDIGCDFVGYAFQDQSGPNIRWLAAAGNCNDKYKRITVRYGKGIAGRVISTDRPMQINEFPSDILGKALEYPIMLAEKLLYAYAVPIHFNGMAKGVLLVGQRTKKPISEEAQIAVKKAASRFEDLMKSL